MATLVTGAAGFIGFHVSKALLERGETVIAIDNLNDYYDVSLKEARLEKLEKFDNFTFHKIDISDKDSVFALASDDITNIIHLAAQAGVRYSLENPFAYVTSNLVGHMVMLELCRNLNNLEHFIYASSSSVYGGNEKLPYSTEDKTDNPVSLYAATKKSNELLTHSYHHLYGIPSTGLRFFTVYGPWGRPDMAAFLFLKAIIEDEPIKLFNQGDMKRDFTYIDDITNGILACFDKGGDGYKIYNLGNNKSEKLTDFISVIEQSADKKAEIILEDMQPGDIRETYADIKEAREAFGYNPKTAISEGIPQFVEWYKEYYSH